MPTTITEALQEIKTIQKRIEKKRTAVLQYVARDSRIKDPLEKDGSTSKGFIATERQAINDLEARVVKIRTAIQQANLKNELELDGKKMSVADWLTWRREISEGENNFLRLITNTINGVRQQIQRPVRNQGIAVAVNEANADMPQVEVALDEAALLKEQESLETTLGTLDGKLSLYNATAVIAV